MKKQLTKEIIYNKHYEGFPTIRFKDLPMDKIKPDDILDIERVEEFWGSDHGHEDHTDVTILRERFETDEEFEKRKKEMEKLQERHRDQRYQQYLKLKKEFEEN